MRNYNSLTPIMVATGLVGVTCASAAIYLAAESGIPEPASPEICIVVDQHARETFPLEYPIGKTTVKFGLAGKVDRAPGTILPNETGYELITHALPSADRLNTSQLVEFGHAMVDISINTSETGPLGIDTGCVTYGSDSNGSPTQYIQLPFDHI